MAGVLLSARERVFEPNTIKMTPVSQVRAATLFKLTFMTGPQPPFLLHLCSLPIW